ncbi:hypothetical protein BDV93DRAFT_541686 [Ceratobasidium sp. AG-I]|nr:hypothetical protein BDV93DRAFT_541686 [Ceratobasidium sp. AG-I]
MSSSKVSFTVRPPPRRIDTDDTPDPSRPGSASPDSEGLRLPHRPTTSSPLVPGVRSGNGGGTRPQKRQWASYTGPDSSDEEESDTKEIITGFDAMGVQRLDESKNKPKGPLVIVSQKNRDWRAESMARKRQAMGGFVPESAKVGRGKDGSQGGLGTKGTINDGPQLSGLIVKPKGEGEGVKVEEEDVEMRDEGEEAKEDVKEEEEMDDDQKALKALLSGTTGEERKEIAAIQVQDQAGAWNQPKTGVDAFKEDLMSRPDEAALDDYERVPIDQFGAAMLRGMGYAPGKAASRSGSGRVDPYLPESRPALLGIGAKPRPVDETASGSKNGAKKFTKPDKRYVPIVKVERAAGSAVSSRRTSRSRSGSPPRDRNRDRERDGERERREAPRDDRRERDRDRERDGRRDRDDKKDYDRDDRRDRDRDDRKRERGYDSDRRHDDRPREKDRGGERRREYESDRDYDRRRDRDGDRRKGRDDDERDRRDRRR